MSIQIFQKASSDFLSGVVTSTAKLVVWSTSDSDTSQVVLLAGTDASNNSLSEAVALTGRVEVLTTNSFKTITAVTLSATCTGTVYVRNQGESGARAVIALCSPLPAAGDQFTVGLSGYTKQYTWRKPEKVSIECVADVAGSLDGTYFTLYDEDGSVGVWFDVDNSGTTIPTGASSADRAIEVTGVSTGDAAADVAAAVQAALNGDSEYSAAAADDTVTVTDAKMGARATAAAGDSGFTVTVVDAAVAEAANQIRLDATSSACADNLKRALNAEGTAGVHYGTGTTALPVLTATVDSNVVTLADSINIVRQINWELTEDVGSNLGISQGFVGGDNGTLIAEINAGGTGIFELVTLESTDLADDTLPGYFNTSTDWVQPGGPWKIWLFLDLTSISDSELPAVSAQFMPFEDDPPNSSEMFQAAFILTAGEINRLAMTGHSEFARLLINNNYANAIPCYAAIGY